VVEPRMDPLVWLRKQLEEADVDLLREMVATFVQALMSAEADVLCGAPYGERSVERVNRRNGYRERDFDTRAGTIELLLPKLRSGSYFPGWLSSGRSPCVGVPRPEPVGCATLWPVPGVAGGQSMGMARACPRRGLRTKQRLSGWPTPDADGFRLFACTTRSGQRPAWQPSATC